MSRTTFKSPPVHRFLAASAVFLAIGGSAMAQTATAQSAPQATPPAEQPATPGSGPQAGPGAHRGDKHHGHHGHHGHHRYHGGQLWMKSVDTDRDGAISKAEADALFARIDANRDGKLDQGEMRAYRKAQHEQFRAEMRQRFDAGFQAADKDGDGALTKQEAEAGMPPLARNFDRLDTNKDGKLTRDEIRAGMQRAHDRRGGPRDPNAAPRNTPAAPATQGG